MATSCTDDNKHTQLVTKTVFGLKKYRNMKLGFQHSTVRFFSVLFCFFTAQGRDYYLQGPCVRVCETHATQV